MAATAELHAAIKGLNQTLSSRNDLMKEMRLTEGLTDQAMLFRYFGLRDPETRRVDERYTSMVQILEMQTNDCLFFARQLEAECVRHANLRAGKNRWKYKLPYRRLEVADWTKAIQEGLLPPDDDYASWTKGFREVPLPRWKTIFKKLPPA